MRWPRAVPLAIFALIAGVTALSVLAIERGDNRQELAEVDRTALAIGSALDRRANIGTSYLRAGAALFSAADNVSYDLFRRFAGELRLDETYRGADGIGWAEAIYAYEIEVFEDRVMTQTGSMNPVAPQIQRSPGDLVVPVTYLVPDSERARRAFGYDMYSEPTRRQAMDLATQTNRPAATGKIVLIQEGADPEPGFLIYMPVFVSGDMGERLKGFVYSPFNADDFLNSVINENAVQEQSVRFYDGGVAEENLLAEHQTENGIGVTSSREIRIADRVMTVVVQSTKGNALSPLSMITLLFGLAVASLSMLIARLLTQQALEDQAALVYFAEQNAIRTSLTRELNHRVKNTLANVLSIIALTRRRTDNLQDFADSLDGRIRALSATHDLLTQSEWGTTPLRQVIEAELAPYASAKEDMLHLEGPDIELAPNDALSFGLAIHELATNASKYGALSREGARVSIEWAKKGENLVEVRWVEKGGPSVSQDRKRGFGMDLIEKIVAHELRHPVDLQFDPEGVRCTLLVPVRQPSEFAIRAKS
ncbi:CHASE domain-containing protein [Erythrobacter litoralis]|uniref:histidine kinase n=1 Tax=Erythrobacter litoralis (strain HTCC2594) TaxID=314225 RepID=Q2N855_ERYLH|nr:CHASE domain-containing protein [Erythrobacter litoralis]ABC64136.1 sensory transduction histidine kinase [Erythrobacter litoralis HTCC2594]